VYCGQSFAIFKIHIIISLWIEYHYKNESLTEVTFLQIIFENLKSLEIHVKNETHNQMALKSSSLTFYFHSRHTKSFYEKNMYNESINETQRKVFFFSTNAFDQLDECL